MSPFAWCVLYGDKGQFRAYFDEQAKAEKYVSTHGGVIVALYAHEKANSS